MINRREVLSLILKGAALTFIPGFSRLAFATVSPNKSSISGKLSFYNIHTDEKLSLHYLDKNNRIDKSAIKELNQFFRCHFTGKVYPIKTELFFLLDNIRTRLGKPHSRYRLLSGYRSPEYNRKLFKTSNGVARKSYHLYGMAADVRLEGISMETLYKAALELKIGGVGKYSKYIHVDVGPVRSW